MQATFSLCLPATPPFLKILPIVLISEYDRHAPALSVRLTILGASDGTITDISSVNQKSNMLFPFILFSASFRYV